MLSDTAKLNYSIIIPAFRGHHSIEQLFVELCEVLKANRFSFEVIFVFDAGTKETWETIKLLKNRFPAAIKAIKFNRNFGQHNAIICGISHAKGAFIITMDEDLQHSPQDIPLLIERQKMEDFDVVYGNYNERQHHWFRNITSKILRTLLKIGLPELHTDYSSFRLMKAYVAQATTQMQNSYTFLDGYLMWITTNVGSVKVTHHPSKAGRSGYSLFKLIHHSWNIFITFSHLPIQILMIASWIMFGLSVGYGMYIFLRKIIYNDLISGFATIAIFLGVGFGLVLLGISVLGAYIQKINMKTTRKPNYFESELL